MSETNGKHPTKADQGLTPKRQKVLAYLLKKKATSSASAVLAKEIHESVGGPAICAGMVEAGHLAKATHEEGPSFYLTAAGKKAAAKS